MSDFGYFTKMRLELVFGCNLDLPVSLLQVADFFLNAEMLLLIFIFIDKKLPE